jgi:hypothetical protein
MDLEKSSKIYLLSKRLFPFKFNCPPLDQAHDLGHHFQIRPGAGDLKPAVQAFWQIDAETRNRFFRNRLYAFPLFLLWRNVGLWRFLSLFHICGYAGLCVLAGATPLEGSDDLSR